LKTRNLTRLLAIVLGVVSACSDSGPRHSEPAPLMPLRLGNRWVYRELHISGADTVEAGTMTIELADTVAPSSLTYYSCASGQLIFRTRNDGLSVARYDSDLGTFEDFEILLRYPISVGATYSYESPYIWSGMARIHTRMDTLSTSLGRLPCLTYAVTAGTYLEFGFTPGIGLAWMANAYGTRWILSTYSLTPRGGQHDARQLLAPVVGSDDITTTVNIEEKEVDQPWTRPRWSGGAASGQSAASADGGAPLERLGPR
jgi:hypothetical protein